MVAHQTLTSEELVEAMRTAAAEEDTTFHLLVPIYHGGPGLTWTLGHAKALAQQHLQEATSAMTADGLQVTGEVGGDSPVDAVDEVLRREGADAFAGIIVSTLPQTVSKWLKLDVPSRIQRKVKVPLRHVVGHPATVDAYGS